MRTDARWELLKDERGKTWTVLVLRTFTAPNGKQTTPRIGFKHDRYSFAPNTPDEWPAVGHDFTYDINGAGRKWDDGTPITRKDADDLLHNEMLNSPDEMTRNLADYYYSKVRLVGWYPWYKGSLRLMLRRKRQ